MLTTHLKKIVFLLVSLLFTALVHAQISHFVYLQTENGSPFYVKLNHKIISSSPSGYVILPGMGDSTYQIAIGFPKNEHPEQHFTFSVNDDEGFLIKDFPEKGFQLFNYQTLALIPSSQPVTDSGKRAVVVTTDSANPFTKMLASVVKDSSILQNHEVALPTPAVRKDSSAKVTDTSLALQSNAGKTSDTLKSVPVDSAVSSEVVKTDSVLSPTPSTPEAKTENQPEKNAGTAAIARISNKQDANGLQLVYTDNEGGKIDTIRALIHLDNVDFPSSGKIEKQDISSFADTGYTITPTKISSDNTDQSTGFKARQDSIFQKSESKTAPVQVFTIGPAKDQKQDKKKEESNRKSSSEKKNVKANDENSAAISDVKVTDLSKKHHKNKKNVADSEMVVMPQVVTESNANSDCKSFASNEDFLKLRKKMAAENDADAMIRIAKKYFRSKCYSTEQIKNLSYLFLTDEGKYSFFDAAYPHTSDSDQYGTLQSQLSDEYYINRFKAMIRK